MNSNRHEHKAVSSPVRPMPRVGLIRTETETDSKESHPKVTFSGAHRDLDDRLNTSMSLAYNPAEVEVEVTSIRGGISRQAKQEGNAFHDQEFCHWLVEAWLGSLR